MGDAPMSAPEIDRALDALRRHQDEGLASLSRVGEVRARLERSGFAPAPAVDRRPRWIAGGSIVLAAAILLLWLGTRREPVAFELDGAPAAAGAPIAAQAHGVELRFSEGSTIELARGSLAVVERTSEQGAVLRLDRGLAEIDIRPRPSAGWSVRAGELEVRVHGTRFSVRREGDVIEVEVERGLVEVRRHGAGSVWLRDGERYRHGPPASVDPPTISAPPGGGLAAGQARPPPLPEQIGPRATAWRRQPPARRPPAPPDYQTLVRAGLFDEALAQAEARGFARELETLPRGELLALGDAARFARAPARARAAYEAVRRRFPGTSETAMASFALGRVCADQLADPRCATQAFDDYLDALPDGPLAADALGRLIEARRDAGDNDGARRAAARYLERHPDGPRRELARSVLGATQ